MPIHIVFVSLRHRLCRGRLRASPLTGDLIYEKDVFERLSLCIKNLASSEHHNRQMTTRRLRGAFLYTIVLYSSYWRGLTALSILCDVGNARAFDARMGRETDTYAFFVS